MDITHLWWISQYIVEKQPDVIVHLGDHWDMPSLSSYDKGKKQMEGRRYKADVHAGNVGMQLLDRATDEHNKKRRAWKEKLYLPEKHLLRGNHEDRINRAVEEDATLDGVVGFHDLESPGWEVHDFKHKVWIDGVCYVHFVYNPNTGYPLGGMCATRLKNVGHSFTMGHQQTLDMAMSPIARPDGESVMRRALVCGACYLHDEDYKGPQANDHWRGIIVKNQVDRGDYSITEVTLDFLCRKYEGVRLSEWRANLGNNPTAIYAPTFEEWLDTRG